MPEENRTFFFWHVFVEGLEPGVCYAWRIDGPSDTATTGRAFDKRKLLVDPWARAVSDALWDRRRVIAGRDPGRSEMRAIVAGPAAPPAAGAAARALEGAVVYELHVGGFTRDPSSGVRNPGTFAGLIEKIPYLQDLGITHVELLPVMAFDEQDVPDAAFTRGLRNYWGYSTHSFFSPHPRYCVNPADAPREFRALTDALHAAGIGVLLDVVFNHTAEGGALGPVINFKGLANDVFYHLDAADKRRYRDYTGCGNTVNCNHPLVTSFIVHCLEYWVEQLGVDGFRFDLASVFARGQDGGLMADPPVPWAIESSRTLAPRAGRSPRPGTQRGSTTWAHSPAWPGRSGTAVTATSCAGSCAATPTCSARSRRASPAVRISMRTTGGFRATASISSPATTALRSTTW